MKSGSKHQGHVACIFGPEGWDPIGRSDFVTLFHAFLCLERRNGASLLTDRLRLYGFRALGIVLGILLPGLEIKGSYRLTQLRRVRLTFCRPRAIQILSYPFMIRCDGPWVPLTRRRDMLKKLHSRGLMSGGFYFSVQRSSGSTEGPLELPAIQASAFRHRLAW